MALPPALLGNPVGPCQQARERKRCRVSGLPPQRLGHFVQLGAQIAVHRVRQGRFWQLLHPMFDNGPEELRLVFEIRIEGGFSHASGVRDCQHIGEIVAEQAVEKLPELPIRR